MQAGLLALPGMLRCGRPARSPVRAHWLQPTRMLQVNQLQARCGRTSLRASYRVVHRCAVQAHQWVQELRNKIKALAAPTSTSKDAQLTLHRLAEGCSAALPCWCTAAGLLSMHTQHACVAVHTK